MAIPVVEICLSPNTNKDVVNRITTSDIPQKGSRCRRQRKIGKYSLQ